LCLPEKLCFVQRKRKHPFLFVLWNLSFQTLISLAVSPHYGNLAPLGSGPWSSKLSLATVAKTQQFSAESGPLGNVADASNIAESAQEEREPIIIL